MKFLVMVSSDSACCWSLRHLCGVLWTPMLLDHQFQGRTQGIAFFFFFLMVFAQLSVKQTQ